jgi:hypothetical protein
VFFLNNGEVHGVNSFSNNVLDGLKLNVFFIDVALVNSDSLTLRLLWSLGGLGFCLGNRCDDKPLTWADFKPLSSREDLKGFSGQIMPQIARVTEQKGYISPFYSSASVLRRMVAR